MRLAVGGDHAGVRLKAILVDGLRGDGHAVLDLGTFDETPVDFPEIAQRTCAAVLDGSAERGILAPTISPALRCSSEFAPRTLGLLSPCDDTGSHGLVLGE